jgi:hypothetical protein
VCSRRTLILLIKHSITSSTSAYYNFHLTNLKVYTAIFKGYFSLLQFHGKQIVESDTQSYKKGEYASWSIMLQYNDKLIAFHYNHVNIYDQA